ncbi:MAG: hypothetical protein HC848_00220 [Limnobacter sp.]|nr:hypothetical protein [Limnobacter sp.]
MKAAKRPVDDCILSWVNEPRLIESRLEDSLWLRPLDIPKLLSARSYAVESSIVLNIVDALSFSSGSFLLETSTEGGQCKTSNAPADVTLNSATLGSLLIGGQGAAYLHRCGLIKGDAKAIQTLNLQFSTPRLPWATDKF